MSRIVLNVRDEAKVESFLMFIRDLPYVEAQVVPTIDEQLIAALENTHAKEYALEVDAQGGIIIDKDKHPDLYDWAVNG